MPRNSVPAVMLLALTIAPRAALAQNGGKRIDPQLRADILQLIHLTHAIKRSKEGVRQSAEWMRPRLRAALPDTPHREKIIADYAKRVEAIPDSPEFVNGLVAIYAKYFSDDDMKALMQFYSTPAGRRFNKHAADIEIDSMQLSQEVVADELFGVFTAVCDDYPELQGRAKFCGSRSANRAAADPK